VHAGGGEAQQTGAIGIGPWCAASGAAGGYLHDQSKKCEQKAYEAGVKDAQASKPK
jgi:hypothetical protein